LIFSPSPCPGIGALRSRGIDITPVAPFAGSRRISMIVSERTGFFSLTSTKRRSEPSRRIVCGWPAGTPGRTPLMPGIGAW
jgi:hypothetical protein